MSEPTFTAPELASELGRTVDWLYANRQHLQKTQKMPPPLPGGPPLVWDKAQIYAWKDRGLPREQRMLAAAYRAAEAAARNPPAERSDDDTAAANRLNALYVEGATQ